MVLDKLGVSLNYSAAIIDGNNVINGKPHPEVFLKGAEALGLEPSECLVFEDSIAGCSSCKDKVEWLAWVLVTPKPLKANLSTLTVIRRNYSRSIYWLTFKKLDIRHHMLNKYTEAHPWKIIERGWNAENHPEE